MAVDRAELQLPMSIVGYSDVGHLLTEVENVDNFLRQAAIRETGTPMQLPKTSKLLEELVEANKLNLLEAQDRTTVLNLLKAIRSKAPVIHMSFNNDPSPIFLERLITWMRQQLHPFVLLQIGLNPSIGAGCMVRTTNRLFDMSLRHQFTEQRELLMSKLRGLPDEDTAELANQPTVVEAEQAATEPGQPITEATTQPTTKETADESQTVTIQTRTPAAHAKEMHS